jgi:sugar phosphate isomerase/epimerase
MITPTPIVRPLGTMVAYGFPRGDVEVDLHIAARLGATLLEILPDWRQRPDPIALRTRVASRALAIQSAHGCWGGQAIAADRVDLSDLNDAVRKASVRDLMECVDWLAAAGGSSLVVHPGGLSDPAQTASRRAALAESLNALADHARERGVVVCVENMPPGVHPGSRMAELAELVSELARAEVRLALDTGHANLTSSADAETEAAGRLLWTTHVHDNNGRQDAHEPPGAGTIDWLAWVRALDTIGYRGPIMLECIRHLRQYPESLNEALRSLLHRMTARTS